MEENYILNSDCEHLPPLPVESTVPSYILRKLKEHEQKQSSPCITNPMSAESFTYSEVILRSGILACSLYNLGFRKGDTLIYCSHDGANLHAFFLGVWRANGILRSVYPEDTDQLLDRILESKSKWLLCDEAQAAQCLQISKMAPWEVTIIVFGKVNGCMSAADLFTHCENDYPIPELESCAEDIALILPTSGTTGASKGAIFTHKTIVLLLRTLEAIPLTEDAGPIFLVGKQTHFSGSLLALSCMTAGRSLLMLSNVNMKDITKTLAKYKPPGLFLFPKYLMELAEEKNNNYKLNSVRNVSTGGVVVGPSLVNVVKKFPNFQSFIVLYGMTECGLLSTNVKWTLRGHNGLSGSPINDLPQFSCGRLPPETSLIVRNIQTGTNVGPNEKGELYFKSNFLCEGYLNRPEESKEAFQDGWIRTGDLGYYDNAGFVYVVDRVKETFKYFNNHICPSQLEDIIIGHSAVAEVCVVGIKDPEGGDTIPRAYVVLKENTTENVTTVTADEILSYANARLASYKHLRGGLFILNKLPLGKTGKVARRMLSEEIPHGIQV